jgi:hypothetical protein
MGPFHPQDKEVKKTGHARFQATFGSMPISRVTLAKTAFSGTPPPQVDGTAGKAGEMVGIYPKSMDPDPAQAHVMYPGTPYEHLMLPVDTK